MVIVNKILVFLFVCAICVTIRAMFKFLTAYMNGTSIDMSMNEEITFLVSFSYIITMITTGFNIV